MGSAAGMFCFPGAPWCDADMGLAWIVVVVALQLAFLYLALGGPAAFVSRFAAGDDWLEQDWGPLQVGLPMALAMAFPALAALAVIDRWLRPVGLLEIALVQGAYCLLLLHWSRRLDGAREEAIVDPATAEARAAEPTAPPPPALVRAADLPRDRLSAIDAGVAAILPRAEADGIPLFPGAARPPAPPPAGAATQPPRPELVYGRAPDAYRPPAETGGGRGDKTVERLLRTYMWDDIGTGEPFKLARRLAPAQLLAPEDGERFGAGLLDAMRDVCRHTIVIHHRGTDLTTLESLIAMHAIDGFDEYSADLMQRLTYSALLGRQRLFVDQTDIEIFGKDLIACLYRLALFEAQTLGALAPVAGRPPASAQAGLH